jgi:peptidoglycan/LPS O-acetylase OafA/YrhL
MRRDIQALRGLAVLAVVLYHVGGFGFHGGFLGVDIFFVISGFVITKKLSQTEGSLGRVLKDFYLRRIRRILPASVLVIALTLLGSYLFLSPLSFHRLAMDGFAATFFVPNLFFLHQQTDYLNQGLDASPFLHYWSLGVEEQFYFIWPLVFFGAFKKKILPVLISLVFFASLGIIWTSHNSVQSFYLPFTRFWEFMAGASLIYLTPLSKSWSYGENKRGGGLGALCAFISWSVAICSAIFITSDHPTPGLTTLIPVVAAVGIIAIGFNTALLRPLAWLGDISFSLYLVHWPIIIFFASGKVSLPLMARCAILVLSLGAAALLYYFYENPIRRSKKIARKSLLLLLIALLVGGVSAGSLQAASSHIKIATKSFSIDLSEPVIYADGCHLPFDVIAASRPCLFGETTATKTIALVGDSHAAQWFAGLEAAAKLHHWKLLALTKSSCPPAIWAITRAGSLDASCIAWAKKVQSQLAASKPDLIVLSSYTQYQYVIAAHTAVSSQATMAGPTYADKWSAGLNDFLSPLLGGAVTSSRIVLLGDTPNPTVNSPACLAKHLSHPQSCDFTYRPSAATTATKALSQQLGILYVDPTKWLCNPSPASPTKTSKSPAQCLAVIGGHNTYRDASHISVATSHYLSGTLAKALNL